TEGSRFLSEGRRPLVEPILQRAKTANIRETLVSRIIFKQAAFADDLLLFGENLVHIVTAEALVLDNDLRKHVFRLAQRQPERCREQAFASALVQIDLHLFVMAEIENDLVEQRSQVLARRQREVQHRHFLFQLGGNLHDRRNQNDGLETVLQVQRDLLQLPDDRKIVSGQEWMKILENENGWFHLFDYLIQGGQRVLGGWIAELLGLNGGARGNN